MENPVYRGIKKVPLFYRVLLLLLISGLLWYVFVLGRKSFVYSYSTVLEDRHGVLMGAAIANDGQWRFPPTDSLPSRYVTCLLSFEDKRFYKHPGVDLRALGRAMKQNLEAGKVVSGGSTLSMQLVRISRPAGRRSVGKKLVEILLATRLEWSFSKEEILRLYAADAPFGGNVRGLGAASWRYFGRDPNDLSWAESALLAILPNSPALVHPGRNRERLLQRRNALLIKLRNQGTIDSMTCHLAISEPLPERPRPIPSLCPHLLQQEVLLHPGKRIRTTLDATLQERAIETVKSLQKKEEGNGIHNAAVLVCEQETGNVLVYIGNSVLQNPGDHGGQVDILHAERSYGSLLKPVLFASMLEDGMILPGTLVPDIPTNISGFAPKNYEKKYDGAVPASRALARSLNIPAVRMLQQYGYEKFLLQLRKLGLKSLKYEADRYGLSLILGGGETSLWELAGMYSSMSRVLLHYTALDGKYRASDYHGLNVYADSLTFGSESGLSDEPFVFHASSLWLTYQALVEVNRPDAESFWQNFSSRRPVAWKTGTSFGNRDGWAIGSTSRYLVGVWTGNADGEGRPLLTGLGCAAPVMFALFDQLPEADWFRQPYDEMVKVPVCRKSGHRPCVYCDQTDSVWIGEAGLRTIACPYHKQIYLDKQGKKRVNLSCSTEKEMKAVSWFVLPPAMEWYYKSHDPQYRPIPPLRKGCVGDRLTASMELLYPHPGSKVYVPTELSGKRGRMIAEAVHRRAGMTIYWHLDDQFIGETSSIHQMALEPAPGKHTLTLVDQEGETLVSVFVVIGK